MHSVRPSGTLGGTLDSCFHVVAVAILPGLGMMCTPHVVHGLPSGRHHRLISLAPGATVFHQGEGETRWTTCFHLIDTHGRCCRHTRACMPTPVYALACRLHWHYMYGWSRKNPSSCDLPLTASLAWHSSRRMLVSRVPPETWKHIDKLIRSLYA